ncbi:MAG: transglycosylase SLT domain-containing protein [Gemmatimonas sp.]
MKAPLLNASRPSAGGVRGSRKLLLAFGAALLVGCQSRPLSPLIATGAAPAAEPSRGDSRASAPGSAIKTAPTDSTVALKSVEVEKTVAGVFGDTNIVAPLVDVSMNAGPTWDIDVRSYEGQERVAYYVNLFTQGSRNRFQERLRQGTRYEPMIRAKLRAGGIPEDMSYIAMVESGFDPNAYSSAAAVGMWQFMSSTARDVGLRVDWWVDERRDPAKATDAAIRFLRDLQNQFGSLYLAAAAYNGGPGRVSRGLTRFAEEMEGSAGEDRFFALAEHDYLRSETKNYVPQIIAAALVGKESARYGFNYDTLPEYLYDSLEVAAGTPLAVVAEAATIELSALRELNPAVLRGMAPPNSSIWIRLPQNGPMAVADVAMRLDSMPDESKIGYRSVKTTGSESSASIASKAGISSKQLAMYNPGLKSTKKGKLVSGQTVRVPTAQTVAAASSVPDPSIERYGTSTVAATRSGAVHIVKRGESLGLIARRYKTTVANIKRLNNMRGDRVVAGQALRVKAASAPKASSASRTTSKKPVAKATASKPATSKAKVSKKPASAKASASKKTVAKKPAPKKPIAKKATVPKKGTVAAKQ